MSPFKLGTAFASCTAPQGTMIMGADVTHNVAGISVAGVVASVDSSFATHQNCHEQGVAFIQTHSFLYVLVVRECFDSVPGPEPKASYFHEIRGQSPYTLNTLKQRNRQSEERIIDLTRSPLAPSGFLLAGWGLLATALGSVFLSG